MDIEIRGAGEPVILPAVYKRTWVWELAALRALAQAPKGCAPVLIDGGEDEAGAWALTPFYEGTHPAENAEVPPSVFDWLAAMHAHFLAHAEHLNGLSVTDESSWRRLCLQAALPAVQAALVTRRDATLERAADMLRPLAQDARMLGALPALPMTLVHADVHAGNVLVSDGSAVLIDWGNARVGPRCSTSPTARPGVRPAMRHIWLRRRMTRRGPMSDTTGPSCTSMSSTWDGRRRTSAPSRSRECSTVPKRPWRASGML
jgi:hypothetical protein